MLKSGIPTTPSLFRSGSQAGTDEETWDSDPRSRRFDFGADPLNYAESQIRLVKHLRGKITERSKP